MNAEGLLALLSDIAPISVLVSTNKVQTPLVVEALFTSAPSNIAVCVVDQSRRAKPPKWASFVTYVNSSTNGLSKSRNIALQNARGSYALITDDDVEIDFERLRKAVSYLSRNSYDFATVQIAGGKGVSCRKPRKFRYLDIFRVRSVQLLLGPKITENTYVGFDEDFGLGATWESCEENLFSYQLLQNGYRGICLPYQLVSNPGMTTGDALGWTGITARHEFLKRVAPRGLAFLFLSIFLIKKVKLILRR